MMNFKFFKRFQPHHLSSSVCHLAHLRSSASGVYPPWRVDSFHSFSLVFGSKKILEPRIAIPRPLEPLAYVCSGLFRLVSPHNKRRLLSRPLSCSPVPCSPALLPPPSASNRFKQPTKRLSALDCARSRLKKICVKESTRRGGRQGWELAPSHATCSTIS